MKHAFLIIIHTNYGLVSRLLKKLDHPDNTLYIHVDKNSSFSKQDEELLISSCIFSKIVMVDRYPVNWGGYSQINVELRLFEFASRGEHDYYHLLSGVDFPTKPMKDIHDFFSENAGYEFVHFCGDEFNKSQANRYKLYHFFQEKRGRKNNIYTLIDRGLLLLQKLLRVDRTRKYADVNFKFGSNWVSISHAFITYLLSNENKIKKLFSYSFCSDEGFVQTILYSSPFKDKIFNITEDGVTYSNMRSVDWARGDVKAGSPYTYTVNDYDELVGSKNLFCRKITDSTPTGNALIEKLEQL